ncbi:cytochrome P450 [Tepidiforma flava]|uniref:Cytochrome P450 n=1 Tax=Tepidiforma flava TaxID=3004094 RepID=A0ABY7M9B0_9CHLR|nr:cytochrome P450 [Tepidiforma flava]WBL37119.1 cytochrome P450 [Tepidiforma flava]
MAEMLSILQQILVAGNETTTNLIASGMMILVQRPELQERLRAEPDRIPTFVEEALQPRIPRPGPLPPGRRRYRNRRHAHPRRLPHPPLLRLRLNRDEAEFPHADEIDLDREAPEGHLAFGRGIHYCLGAALARLEARIAFTLLLQRLRAIRAAEGKNDYTHVPSVILRGLKALYLEFEPA